MPVPIAASISGWFVRWRPLLPLMAAELIVWLGFGAFLPVLPLYVTERGVDIPSLGIVVAAWPAARLVGEPLFGWLADRTRRTPLMVVGLFASAVLAVLPLFATGVVAFCVLRGLAGLATAAYDPAARGYLMDVTPADRRGEAFGLYGAAQMAGFLLGPALGGLAAAVTGNAGSVFVLGGVAVLVAGLVVAVTIREQPHRGRSLAAPPESLTENRREAPISTARAAAAALSDEAPGGEGSATRAGRSERPEAPRSLLNRVLLGAIVLNFGAFFAGGTWEVIWSLFISSRGASLQFIGFTFALFGLPVLVVSPVAGRFVDRRGILPFLVFGSLAAVVTGILYTLTDDLVVIAGIVVVEAIGWALVNPALYSIVALGSPAGRSSTAQGVFGSAGTVAYILSALVAGQLFARDQREPFYLLSLVVFVTLIAGVAIAGRQRLETPQRAATALRPNPVASPPAVAP